MPKLEQFSGVTQNWINQLVAVSNEAIKDSIEKGADHMREVILDSPTGTDWHADKNAANGFSPGQPRIGNKNPSFWEVDENSGNMLNSVTTLGPARSGSGSTIVGMFGWVDANEGGSDYYFVLQDTGNYKVGNQKGMGLLNVGNKTTEKYGAKVVAEETLIKSLTAAGLTLKGRTGDLF